MTISNFCHGTNHYHLVQLCDVLIQDRHNHPLQTQHILPLRHDTPFHTHKTLVPTLHHHHHPRSSPHHKHNRKRSQPYNIPSSSPTSDTSFILNASVYSATDRPLHGAGGEEASSDTYMETITRRTWVSASAWQKFPRMSTRRTVGRQWWVVEGEEGGGEE